MSIQYVYTELNFDNLFFVIRFHNYHCHNPIFNIIYNSE